MRKVDINDFLGQEGTVDPTNISPLEPMVFLGGTCNGSTWREKIIPMINVKCFNPVVAEYSMETQQLEQEAKRQAQLSLYVVTPKQTGFYSFSEMMHAALREPKKTVIAFLADDDGTHFDEQAQKSIDATKKLLTEETGAKVVDTIEDAAAAVNEIAANLPPVGPKEGTGV